MKKISYTFASFLLTGMLAAGCGTDENEQPILDNETDTIDENTRDFPNKVQNVQNVLTELANHVNSSEGPEKIQEAGGHVENHWNLVKAEVEEQYPEDYAAITESITPLIDETKKNSPDTEKLTSLLDETNEKLKALLEQALEPKKQEEG